MDYAFWHAVIYSFEKIVVSFYFHYLTVWIINKLQVSYVIIFAILTRRYSS
jgi:hypothetical protein